jgi:hypothetical protein
MLWSATGVGVDELEIISDLWRTGDYCQVVAGPFARIEGGAVNNHQSPIAGPNR